MPEKIDRKTDENLYQPRIHSERIRELYLLKAISGIPMTVLVDMAIRELVAGYQVGENMNSSVELFPEELFNPNSSYIVYPVDMIDTE